MNRVSRFAPLACIVALAGLVVTAAVVAKDQPRTDPPKDLVERAGTVSDLEKAGWNPSQAGVVWLFGGVKRAGAYTLAPVDALIEGAGPAPRADHIYIVRRSGGITFISEPLERAALNKANAPKTELQPGDAVVVTRLGGFGPTTRPTADK